MEEAWKRLKRFHCRDLTRPIPVPLSVGGPICGNEIRAPALIGISGGHLREKEVRPDIDGKEEKPVALQD